MSRRRNRLKSMDELPRFETRSPIALTGTAWLIEKTDDSNSIQCEVRLAGMVQCDTSYNNPAMPLGGAYACWLLKLNRRKVWATVGSRNKNMPSQHYTVSLAYCPDGTSNDKLQERTIFRGQAARWPEAIFEVRWYAPIVETMKTMAKEWRASGEWFPIRPFMVRWPWNDVREPNAMYSEFKLTGGWRLEDTEDGSAASVFRSKDATVGPRDLRNFAAKFDANAFLFTDKEGQHWIYHRRGMQERDPIDIDDWRGRIIAGSQEDWSPPE